MEWLMVIGFILFGIGLIVIEIIFVPGTTIVGIGGLICAGYGVYLSYSYFGSGVGTGFLIGTLVFSVAALVYAFKSNAWDRFSLKDSMEGKVNDEYVQKFDIGEEGEAISSIKPIGKASFNEKIAEVRSLGSYIESGQRVKIIKIDNSRIFVQPLTNES